MFGVDVKITDNFQAVQTAADKASFKNISHAASSIRKDAIESITPGDEPSAPGSPPHTRATPIKTGKNAGKFRKGEFQRAIVFDVNKQTPDAVIGPRASVVDDAFAVHEFGLDRFGVDYPERPTMAPALDRALPRFVDSYSGSLSQ